MIRHIKTALLLASAAALLTGSAAAQYRYPYYPGPRADDRDMRGSLINRVLFDLDRARNDGRVDHHERDRMEDARHDLLVFQDHYVRGKFDKDRLDGAIDNIHKLVDSGRISPRDRDVLTRDMYALRDFRANRGAYNGGYRYRD